MSTPILNSKSETESFYEDWLADIESRRQSIIQVYYDGWITDVHLDMKLAELDREEETCRKYAAQSATRIPDESWKTELPF